MLDFQLSLGKGGQGCAFRREKFVKGGPDGGDGGKGGDVLFLVDNNTDTLSNYKGRKLFKADNGKQGLGWKYDWKIRWTFGFSCTSWNTNYDDETNEVIFDLLEVGEKVLFLEGGKGGLEIFTLKFKKSKTNIFSARTSRTIKKI